jgi:hypothetical protein
MRPAGKTAGRLLWATEVVRNELEDDFCLDDAIEVE